MRRSHIFGILVVVLLVLAACGRIGHNASSTPPASPSSSSDEPETSSPSPPSPTASPSGSCSTAQAEWPHVYHPDRLKVLASCESVTGTVYSVRHEPDGDYHIDMSAPASLLTSGNYADQHGKLVVEEICQGTISQADAIGPCQGMPQNLPVPHVGQMITVTGPWVDDQVHGWNEIHPAVLTVSP